MRQWVVTVGKKKIQLTDKEGNADAMEICTRALEYLQANNIDYAVGPLLEARSGDQLVYTPGTDVLANAGRYYEAAELQKLIRKSSKDN